MARASENLKGWYEVLNALNQDNEPLARQLMIKYDFDTGRRAMRKKRAKSPNSGLRYSYTATHPDGRMHKAKTLRELSDLTGLSEHGMSKMFGYRNSDEINYIRGENKGWRIRRERITRKIIWEYKLVKKCGEVVRAKSLKELEEKAGINALSARTLFGSAKNNQVEYKIGDFKGWKIFRREFLPRGK